VQFLFGVHVAAWPTAQYASFLGCYKDDKDRDLKKKGPSKANIKKCRDWAKKEKVKYFGLQWGDECYGDNTFGTPRNKYHQIPPDKCVRDEKYQEKCGNEEHKNYCGGGWSNALYLTEPVGTPMMVKANTPLQIVSPWKKTFCMYGSKADNVYKIQDNVFMQNCNKRGNRRRITEKNYLWSFDKDDRILNSNPEYKGMCLDMHLQNKNVFMSPCHGGKNQKWFWKNGANLGTKENNFCLDWHTGNNNLFMGGCHKGENLKFWWNIGQPVQIKGGVQGDRKYLSTNYEGSRVDLWSYPGNNQKWEFVKAGDDWYNILLTGGMNSRANVRQDNAYMSTNHDGSVVDLWHDDDGSGRQRWKITKDKDGYFTITVGGGVSGDRKYLSTTANGDKVDLWKAVGDRQKWKLHGSFIPTPKPTPKPTPRPTPVPVKNLVSGGGWKIVGGQKKCTISIENGVNRPCAVSPNYPKEYSREVACEISMGKTEYVTLEGSSEKYFDYLTLGGKQYSGKLAGKKVKVKGGGNAKWTADFWEGTKGWKFCKSKAPAMKVVGGKKKAAAKGKVAKAAKKKGGKKVVAKKKKKRFGIR